MERVDAPDWFRDERLLQAEVEIMFEFCRDHSPDADRDTLQVLWFSRAKKTALTGVELAALRHLYDRCFDLPLPSRFS